MRNSRRGWNYSLGWNPCSTVIRHGRHCACETKDGTWLFLWETPRTEREGRETLTSESQERFKETSRDFELFPLACRELVAGQLRRSKFRARPAEERAVPEDVQFGDSNTIEFLSPSAHK